MLAEERTSEADKIKIMEARERQKEKIKKLMGVKKSTESVDTASDDGKDDFTSCFEMCHRGSKIMNRRYAFPMVTHAVLYEYKYGRRGGARHAEQTAVFLIDHLICGNMCVNRS